MLKNVNYVTFYVIITIILISCAEHNNIILHNEVKISDNLYYGLKDDGLANIYSKLISGRIFKDTIRTYKFEKWIDMSIDTVAKNFILKEKANEKNTIIIDYNLMPSLKDFDLGKLFMKQKNKIAEEKKLEEENKINMIVEEERKQKQNCENKIFKLNEILRQYHDADGNILVSCNENGIIAINTHIPISFGDITQISRKKNYWDGIFITALGKECELLSTTNGGNSFTDIIKYIQQIGKCKFNNNIQFPNQH